MSARAILPHAQRAIVAPGKLVDYLLSETHPDGRGKARFFAAHGFSAGDWTSLAAALRDHSAAHPIAERMETPFGVRYVVEGALRAPDGRTPAVRSVWFVPVGREVPELVTAYPLKRRS